MAFNYEGVDMERAMQAKKREILQELTDAKLRILKELSCVDKTTLTRLRQILDDYNRIEYAITQKINIIEQKVIEAIEQINNQSERLEENLTIIENYTDNYEELKRLVNDLRLAIDNLSTTTNDVAQHKVDIATLQAQVALNVENITTNINDISELKEVDTSLGARVTTNETDIATIKANLDTLTGDNSLTDGEILNIRQMITDLQNDIDTIGINYTNVENQITSLEGRLDTAENDIDLLEARVTVNETNIGSLQTSVNDCFQSVSNGKKEVANAITDMGVTTNSDATFATMALNIRTIKTAPDYDDYKSKSVDATQFMVLDEKAYIQVPKTGIYNTQSKLIVPVETVLINISQNLYFYYNNGAYRNGVTGFVANANSEQYVTIENMEDYVSIKGTANTSKGYVRTDNLIDLTDLKSIVFRMVRQDYASASASQFWLHVYDEEENILRTAMCYIKQEAYSTTQPYSEYVCIDVEDLTGNYYVGFNAQNGRVLKLTEMYFVS